MLDKLCQDGFYFRLTESFPPTIPLDFYLIRHGESEVNLLDIVGGRSNDSPLTTKGIEQAENLGKRLKSLNLLDAHLISSPARRTRDTMYLSVHQDGSNFLEYNLQELDQGEFTGRPRKEVYTTEVKERIDKDRWNFKAPGGESQAEVAFRAKMTLYKIMCNGSKNPKKVIFTHGGLIKNLCTDLFNWDKQNAWQIPINNASITHLKYDCKWNLIALNS